MHLRRHLRIPPPTGRDPTTSSPLQGLRGHTIVATARASSPAFMQQAAVPAWRCQNPARRTPPPTAHVPIHHAVVKCQVHPRCRMFCNSFALYGANGSTQCRLHLRATADPGTLEIVGDADDTGHTLSTYPFASARGNSCSRSSSSPMLSISSSTINTVPPTLSSVRQTIR